MKKSDLTKQKILQTALEEFAESGLAATSLGTIAKRGAYSPPLIKYHFSTLELLFKEVVLSVVQAGVEILSSYQEGLESREDLLKAYLHAMVDWIGGNPHYASILLQFYHHSNIKEDFRKLNDQIVRGGFQRVKTMYPDIDNDKAYAIQDQITGSLVRLASTNEGSNLFQVRKRLIESVFSILSTNNT